MIYKDKFYKIYMINSFRGCLFNADVVGITNICRVRIIFKKGDKEIEDGQMRQEIIY